MQHSLAKDHALRVLLPLLDMAFATSFFMRARCWHVRETLGAATSAACSHGWSAVASAASSGTAAWPDLTDYVTVSSKKNRWCSFISAGHATRLMVTSLWLLYLYCPWRHLYIPLCWCLPPLFWRLHPYCLCFILLFVVTSLLWMVTSVFLMVTSLLWMIASLLFMGTLWRLHRYICIIGGQVISPLWKATSLLMVTFVTLMVKILSIDDCQFWLSWWNLSQKRRRSRLAARISHQRRHRYDQFQQVRLQACVPEEQNKQTADRSNAACGLFSCCFTVSTLSAAEQLCNLMIRYSRLRCILRPRHLPEPQIAGKASCKPLAGYAQRCNPIAGVEAISWHSRPSSHDWLVAQTAHQQMQQALRQHQQPTLQQCCLQTSQHTRLKPYRLQFKHAWQACYVPPALLSDPLARNCTTPSAMARSTNGAAVSVAGGGSSNLQMEQKLMSVVLRVCVCVLIVMAFYQSFITL